MVQADSCRQALWKGFLDGSLTPTTTTPDLLLEYDTTLAPCHYSSAKLQTHPSPQAIEFNRHPSRFSGKGSRAGKFTQKKQEKKTPEGHHKHTLSCRPTPATYLCCVTHATAYPCTSRSALHSATDVDASSELIHCWSNIDDFFVSL